jgi:tRNA U34 5-methylaminomethyl-2-thiouridine-forming methyltransferase MnmC
VKESDHYLHDSADFCIKLYLTDAANFTKQEKFHFFFHDPFSPKKNPDLWSIAFFKKLLSMAQSGAILTTYSSAAIARKNLELAGWHVEKIKGFANKREALRATAYL